jgi:hypothetical protein
MGKPVVVSFTASGSVHNYADTSALQSKFAAAAGVDAALVTISVTAGSVVITATIAVPTGTDALSVQSSLATKIGTAASASAALGVTVESVPTIVVASTPPSLLSSPPPSPPPPLPSPPTRERDGNKNKDVSASSLQGTESNVESSESGVSDGGIAGIAIGCLFVGSIFGAGAVILVRGWNPIIKRHKSFEVDVAERRKEEEKL